MEEEGNDVEMVMISFSQGHGQYKVTNYRMPE